MGGISLQFVQAYMVSWLDQTNTAGGPGGTPVPACQGAPLPVQIIGGNTSSTSGTFTDASVAPDGSSATQPTSGTQLAFWNGTGFVPVQTGQGLPTLDYTLATAQAGSGLKVAGIGSTVAVAGTVAVSGSVAVTGAFYQTTQPVSGTIADSNSAAVQGVVAITPGTATTPLRGIAFYCTAAGNITLTMADGSTMTFPIAANPVLQIIGLSVSNITLGTGTAGTFWGTK